MRVDGQRILLTGASSGIGRELVRELASHGALLAISARREPLLDELATEVEAAGGARPHVLPADLSQPGAAAGLAASAIEALGAVDVIVNNAGVGVGGSQWAVGDGDAGRELFETNVWSPLALVAALVPAMRQRGNGAVVNVTSVSQVAAWGGLGHYSASKAALASLTETLRLELQGSGVHVLEVIPGPVETAIQGESRLVPGFAAATRRGPVGDPVVIARRAVRALERERPRLVYPRANTPGYVMPALLRFFIPRVARRIGESIADDPRVVRGGSSGDEDALAARAEWERARS